MTINYRIFGIRIVPENYEDLLNRFNEMKYKRKFRKAEDYLKYLLDLDEGKWNLDHIKYR